MWSENGNQPKQVAIYLLKSHNFGRIFYRVDDICGTLLNSDVNAVFSFHKSMILYPTQSNTLYCSVY